MKFSSAVDALSRENARLWWTVRLLGLSVALLTLGVLLLYDKPGVLIERSSRGLEMVRQTPLRRDALDIEQAIKLMLKARFDTEAVSPEVYLSTRQLELRASEQAELKARQIAQVVLVRSVSVQDNEAHAEIDRVLRAGELRSALKARVKLDFEAISPNELNPYGLRLVTAEPLENSSVQPAGVPKKEGEK